MNKLKIYAVAVLAVMLLNVPIVFAEHITVPTSGTYTTNQPEYKDYNTQGSSGGVFYMFGNSTLNIKDNVVFTNNSSGYMGGVVFLEHNNLNLNIGSNVIFSSNTGTIGGVIGVSGTEEKNIKINIGNGTIFEKNTASSAGGAINNKTATITIGNNVIFRNNYSGSLGGAIYNEVGGNITIGDNVKFLNNSAERGAAAIGNAKSNIIFGKNAEFTGNDNEYIVSNSGNMTFKDGAIFKDNYTEDVLLNYQGGTLNLIANNNNVEFTGNATKSTEAAAAIFNYGTNSVESVVKLWASNKADIIFNNKIKGYKSKIYINDAIEGYQENVGIGKIVLNEDMSEYTGTTNFYGGTIELGKKGKLFGGDINIDVAKATIAMANNNISENNFKSVTVSDNLTLTVDADLENEKMDTISADSFSGAGKITVNKIKIVKDSSKEETIINFADDVLKDKVEFTGNIETLLYKYDTSYDTTTGEFIFINNGKIPIINMVTAAGAVAGSVGGYATQATIVEQAFAGINGKAGNNNKKSANVNSSNLYVSAGDQVFAETTSIEKGLWLRPFILNETVKVGDTDVDNNLYGTLAGIDLIANQDSSIMTSFYLGYVGSKQEFDEVKTTQTGYVVGLTGMIIKDSWYLGATVNGIFNKVSAESEDETNDFDMNMFTIGAKAGYNYNINEKWTLEPNITIMYGMVNSNSYETSLGSINSQNISNILLEPQVKARLGLNNGWQPYGLLGYAANLSGKPTVKADGEELELDSIDGYIEYGIGVNKDFVGTVWSCYAQVTGRSGGRTGFAGNLGIKYKF